MLSSWALDKTELQAVCTDESYQIARTAHLLCCLQLSEQEGRCISSPKQRNVSQ